MPKFFVLDGQINNNEIEITGENYSHIRTVLRYGVNDELTVCDNRGTDYKCVINEITKSMIKAEIISAEKNKCEPQTDITLFQAIPKADKMELIITKCVELGVNRFIPVITSRAIGSMAGKEEKKLERLSRISESAAKQSGRGKIPKILAPVGLKESLDIAKGLDLVLAAYENEVECSIKSLLKKFTGGSIGIFIGPEGGFADNEIELMKANGIKTVTLGPRVLRTETAGFMAVAVVLYELEG